MELRFMTPTEVWEGFNPVKEPLETSIISSEEIDDLIYTKLFFTSENTENGRVRVFANIIYDRRWTDDRAALLVAPALNEQLDYSVLIKRLVSDGYVVCFFDYCGNFADNIHHTSFSSDLSYASFPDCKSLLASITSDARHTPWFQWTKIARRAISMLQEHRIVDKNRIGIIGIGVGAQIAWQTAGIDGRIRALVPINGGGYLWCQGKARFVSDNIPATDSERAFSTGVGAETYARFVTCPTCLIASSNSTYFDVDRVGDIMSLVPNDSKQHIICSGSDEQITKRAFDSLIVWLRANFALDGVPSIKPTLLFEQIGGMLYLRLNTQIDAEEMAVKISVGEPYAIARFWEVLRNPQKVGSTEYIYSVPVNDNKDIIVAYATLGYPEGRVLSTPVVFVIPQAVKVESSTESKASSKRLIYNGNMKLDAFSATTNSIFLDEDVLTKADGPFGIVGIKTLEGKLSLCRSARELNTLDKATFFQFDAYSKDERTITLSVLTYPELRYYTTEVTLSGGDFWQKVMIANTQFKSPEGKTLQKYNDVKKCVFVHAKEVLFNNLLWI